MTPRDWLQTRSTVERTHAFAQGDIFLRMGRPDPQAEPRFIREYQLEDLRQRPEESAE